MGKQKKRAKAPLENVAHHHQGLRGLFVIAGLIAAASVACRIFALDRLPGLSGDEAVMFVTLRDYLRGHADAPALITPTHRPIPLWIGTIYPLAKSTISSPWLLRAPGLFYGLLLAVSGAWAAQRLFARRGVAWAVALGVACLPAHIAYSRMGWDAAQTSLATLFPVYFLLRGAWSKALIATAVGMLIHPLVVFLVPLALPGLFFEWLPKLAKSQKNRNVLTAALLGAGGLAIFVLYRFFLAGRTGGDNISLIAFVNLIADVLSGASSYEYFAAKPTGAAQIVLKIVGLTTLGLLIWAALRTLRMPKIVARQRYFGAACVVALLVYHWVSPYQSNGTERYLLIFTIPVLFAIGLGLEHAFAWPDKRVMQGALAFCVLHVGLFVDSYFLRPSLGQPFTNAVYASGPEEPKAAAYRWIADDARASGSDALAPTVITDGFWTYWVSRYLAGSDGTQIRYIPNNDTAMPLPDRLTTVANFESAVLRNGYALGFSDGSFAHINDMLRQAEVCGRKDFANFGGHPVVSVWKYCPRQISAR